MISKSSIHPWVRYAALCFTLAFLYALSGGLGLMLAVPPGYATIIWPASGIAVGMLILFGWQVWPGILLGSFALNTLISGAADSGLDTAKAINALAIACGATLQALAGYWLVQRYIGLPLVFNRLKTVALLLFLCAPIACLVSATVGVITLLSSGILTPDTAIGNWVTWWAGDTFGVLLFLPVALISPGVPSAVMWRKQRIGTLSVVAVLTIMISLAASFYAWKVTSEVVYHEAAARFEAMADDAERALMDRLNAYNYALLGGAGLFQASEHVTRAEWAQYVKALDVKKNFPGIHGLGVIFPTTKAEKAQFLDRVRRAHPSFSIHPETGKDQSYIITYIEPEDVNTQAVGLDIAFEHNRKHAADIARDRGVRTITHRIFLVQDQEKTPGFLMFCPLYDKAAPQSTPMERRAAFRGWVYAPFNAKNFLSNLTQAQEKSLHLEVFDGKAEDLNTLIYNDARTEDDTDHDHSVFRISRKIEVMQNVWTLSFRSTAFFESQNRSNGPVLILAVGLLFTGLLASFFIVSALKEAEFDQVSAGRRALVIPACTFLIALVGVGFLYQTIHEREKLHLASVVQGQASSIQKLLRAQMQDKMDALLRMASRLSVNNERGAEGMWRADAHNYLAQIGGLKALQWIDKTYHVRWVEPEKGNEGVLGLNIAFDKARANAVRGAAEKEGVTITPPLDLVQGYRGIIAYAPVRVSGRFDGFVAGIFSADEFFDRIFMEDVLADYNVSIKYGGKTIFSNIHREKATAEGIAFRQKEQMFGDVLSLEVTPTDRVIQKFNTYVPAIVLACGVLIAFLLAVALRYILISHARADFLARSNRLNQGILSSSAYLMIATDRHGKVILFNPAAEKALGWTAEEAVGKLSPDAWQDREEVAARAAELAQELGRPVANDLEVFVSKALIDGYETREWTYIAKNGRRFPVSLTVTALRDIRGEVTGYLGVAEDITARREVEKMKSEFISIVSHELRTPLTSIRASLGLIEGTLSDALPEKVRELIAVAHKNSQRLIMLVNDILDLDKIAAGKMRLSLKPESVAQLIEAGVALNAAYAEKFMVSYVFPPVDEGLFVEADADRWQQVFSNFLSNAAKFSPAHGRVEIDVQSTADMVRVSVRDHGPGIPLEFRNRIFGKFSQSDSALTRTRGGSGLGLNISKELVEHMGGNIGFDSVPGEGATFWFELPRAQAPSVEQPQNAPLSSDVQPEQSARKLTHILCIDDDPGILELAMLCLQNVGGYRVTGCSSGGEGIAKALEVLPDLIMIDMMMPDMDGSETLRRLRRHASIAHIPVVFMTARVQPAEVEDYVRQGAADVIAKPFDPMEISAQVQAIWDRVQQGRM